MENSATLLGSVQDVSGTTIRVVLKNESIAGFTYINGQGYKIGQIGSFVKIPIGYIDLYGIVTSIGASAVPEIKFDQLPFGNRWMTIQLVGESLRNGKFERGISQYPTINDEVHIVSERDLDIIYGRRSERFYIKVGHIAGAESVPALVDVNKLINRHSAVVGTTGSGKSTTVAGILSSLSNPLHYPSARIIILDIHGEYGKSLKDRANIFKVNPDYKKGEKQLCLPYWALNFDELTSIAFGEIDSKDKGFIAEKVLQLKRKSFRRQNIVGVDPNNLSVDSPIPFNINRVWLYLHRLVYSTHQIGGSGQKFEPIDEDFDIAKTTECFLRDSSNGIVDTGDALSVRPPLYEAQVDKKVFLSGTTLNIRRPLDGLATKLRDPRYNFIFKPGKWDPNLFGDIAEDLDTLFKNWIGSQKTVTIFDLSGVPLPILNTIIGILLRILYDSLFWARNLSQGARHRPLLVVMEEAHNYLNDNFKGQASSIVQRIVKEGRKYGIGAMIVSQRPSEINPTILSQCGTFFALRLANSSDRGHINSVISDNLEGLTSMLPILKTGEAIVLGEGVKLPMRAMIESPPKSRRPDSQDPVVFDEVPLALSENPGGWGIPMEKAPNYKEFIQVWRAQNPTFVVEQNKFKKKV